MIEKITCESYGPISTGRPGMSNPVTALSIGLYQLEIGLNTDS